MVNDHDNTNNHDSIICDDTEYEDVPQENNNNAWMQVYVYVV
jgi:hypothetical protein